MLTGAHKREGISITASRKDLLAKTYVICSDKLKHVENAVLLFIFVSLRVKY